MVVLHEKSIQTSSHPLFELACRGGWDMRGTSAGLTSSSLQLFNLSILVLNRTVELRHFYLEPGALEVLVCRRLFQLPCFYSTSADCKRAERSSTLCHSSLAISNFVSTSINLRFCRAASRSRSCHLLEKWRHTDKVAVQFETEMSARGANKSQCQFL